MTDWKRIEEILERGLEVWEVKNENINKERREKKRKVIKWTIEELRKGPLKHGTHTFEQSDLWNSDYWEALKQCILERDEHSCQICGCTDRLLEVHHIMPKYLKGRNHPRNLITLCDQCHDEVHRIISRSVEQGIEQSLDSARTKFGVYTPDCETLDRWMDE